MAQEREGGRSIHTRLASRSSPLPHTQRPLWPSPRLLVLGTEEQKPSRSTPILGERKGSRGSRMNLFSEKHGVQTGGFLLSCFTSVKASINSTLIIKSEQCIFGFQQLNSVTAASLGSLASSTSYDINIFLQGDPGLLFLFSSHLLLPQYVFKLLLL